MQWMPGQQQRKPGSIRYKNKLESEQQAEHVRAAGIPSSRQRWETGMPLLSFAGFGSLGPANQYQPQRYRDPERNYDSSINWQKGTHNIRAGFEADLQDANEVQYEIGGNNTVTNA